MSHLDEGQLHALLDGELEESERHTAEAHLATCEECRRLFAEARAFLDQADALIAAVDLPSDAVGRVAPSPHPRARRFSWRAAAWAASLILAAGLGWYSSELRLARRVYEGPAQQASRPAAPPGASPATDQAQPAPAENQALRARNDSPRTPVRRGGAAAAPEQPAAGRAEEKSNRIEPESVEAKAMAEASGARAAQVAPAPIQLAPGIAVRAEEQLPAPDGAGALSRAAAFRQVRLEEAVRTLAGTVRLIDGLDPIRVMVAPGRLVPGADPGRDLVRVVYADSSGHELWLDQQRGTVPNPADEAYRPVRRALGTLSADTLRASDREGSRSLSWVDQDGFRLTLTGLLPAESLQHLARRVK